MVKDNIDEINVSLKREMSTTDFSKRQTCNVNFGRVVLPHTIEDKSLIASFTGFIHDVVPQACSGVSTNECKDKVVWAKFEQTDVNDPIFYSDTWEPVTVGIPPILLVLGYNYGVQIWCINANGEATEVFSWYHGVVKSLKLIPSPQLDKSFKQDLFLHRRPLIAMCEGNSPTLQFSSVSFISLLGGDLVKKIKFKNSILDIGVNRIAVVVTFVEKIAIFNSRTLENVYTITTCYVISNYNVNPISIGTRWLAYSDQKLISWKRSQGGSEAECSQSYTATVISAAKSLGMGLKELSGSVANTFSTNLSTSPSSNAFGAALTSNNNSHSNGTDNVQAGVVTIIDIQNKMSTNKEDDDDGTIAHFVAHSDPISMLSFDPSGLLLLTVDRRGHRFNLFRIQPHMLGSAYASVHHLYVLYRGDTTAQIQDITFSIDSRWVAVTSLRGTTHVFPITPYGGPIGLRTHSTPHVVNKLSRFHRSAGIISDGRNSPIMHESMLSSSPNSYTYPNPCLPPFPHPTIIHALLQIRSPAAQSRHLVVSQGQEDNYVSTTNMVACFSSTRLLNGSVMETITASFKKAKKVADSLFVISSHGTLVQYNLEPRPVNGVPKDKLCDETLIELKVEPKLEWNLMRQSNSSHSNAQLSLPRGNPLLTTFSNFRQELATATSQESRISNAEDDDRWLSQVEIVTHLGPHRRIWMGPQFVFKPYNKACNDSPEASTDGSTHYAAQSRPVNINNIKSKTTPLLPFFIEGGSCSSLEQSPRLLEPCGACDSDSSLGGNGELKIQEDLADAMIESPASPVFNAAEVTDNELMEMCNEKLSVKKTRRTKKKRSSKQQIAI